MADNPLKHKLGPLPLWEWLLIGAGTGAALYLYEKKKGTAEEPKEELAASTNNPLAGGGGSGEGSGGSVPGVAGPIGEPGPAGASPPATSALTAGQEALLSAAAEGLNRPPVGAETVAPQAKAKPSALAGEPKTTHSVNKNGEHFTVHTYADGKVEKFQTGAEKAADAGERLLAKKPKSKAGSTGHISHAKKAPLKAKHVAPPKPKKVAAKPKPAPKKKKR